MLYVYGIIYFTLIRLSDLEDGDYHKEQGMSLNMKWIKRKVFIAVLLLSLLSGVAAWAADEADVEFDGAAPDGQKTQEQVEEERGNPWVTRLAERTVLPKGKLKKAKGHIVYQCKEDKSFLKDCWAKIGKYYYHFNEKGYAWKGAKTYKGYRYYFDKKGRMYVRKFRRKGSKTYYYGKSGAMIRNAWGRYKGDRYYFGSKGAMVKKKWVNGFWVGADGKYVASKTKDNYKTFSFKPENSKQRLIIVGASRVKQMKGAVTSDKKVIYITKAGQGFSWFYSKALPKLRKTLKKYPKSKVVIQMGNNDLNDGLVAAAFSRYAMQLSELIRKYPKAEFYFMDALPSMPLSEQKNQARQEFNELLRSTFPEQYIGGYDYLVEIDFQTGFDNAHYSALTYKKIFNYILSKVK